MFSLLIKGGASFNSLTFSDQVGFVREREIIEACASFDQQREHFFATTNGGGGGASAGDFVVVVGVIEVMQSVRLC